MTPSSSLPDAGSPQPAPLLTGHLSGWSALAPDEDHAVELAELLRRHEKRARGWAGASEDSVLVEVSARGYRTRENVALRDDAGRIRGWASAHDRAAGRMLMAFVVDDSLPGEVADEVATALLGWADSAARRIGAERGLAEQQIDSGAFADDARQRDWLTRGGFEHVRTWWQMTRPVAAEDFGEVETQEGVRIRRVRRQGTGLPDEDDLRAVHDVLESAFADHFNSHEETFDEFLFRLREDPGHRWDHWWIAELVDDGADSAEAAGALVGSLSEGTDGRPDGSYVEYIGVLQSARGRGVAKALLSTIIADAVASGRDRVDLEVDADSPTGADGLYLSMGWTTSYVTESWHRTVQVAPPAPS